MKILILISLTFLLFCSCVEKSVDFLEPQPEGSKNLSAFAPVLLGIYESLDGNESIEILENLIIRRGTYDIKMSKTEVDTSIEYILKDSILINTLDSTRIPVELKNDSVFGYIPWADTAFIISDKNVLRKMGSTYFLNSSTDSIWKMVRLNLEGNVLKLATINKTRELTEIKKYTTLYNIIIQNDTITDYKLKPKKREFRKMNESDSLFTDEEQYIKAIESIPKNAPFIFFR